MRSILPFFALPLPIHAGINWDVYEYGVVPTFKWSRSFPDDGTDPGGFHVNCRVKRTFHANMYKLKDLPEPPPIGLAPWHDAIEDFLAKREYPGTWDGVDHKGQDREIVMMEWLDVPSRVREWIEEQQRTADPENYKRWMFGVFRKPRYEGEKVYGTVRPKGAQRTAKPAATSTATQAAMTTTETPSADAASTTPGMEAHSPQEQGQTGTSHVHLMEDNIVDVADKDKIVVFAAGSIYEILPLWVSQGSGCESELENLANYRSQAVDHSILAWPIDHTKPRRDLGKRDMQFTIEAMSVTETEDGKRARKMWEKLYRSVRRHERKQLREERLKKRKEIEEERERDEL